MTASQEMFYETVAANDGARIGSVPGRTEHSIALRDEHLADPEIVAKHRPWIVCGGSWKTGPWRVASAKTPGVGFLVQAGWPEIQEALCLKVAAVLNGDDV